MIHGKIDNQCDYGTLLLLKSLAVIKSLEQVYLNMSIYISTSKCSKF